MQRFEEEDLISAHPRRLVVVFDEQNHDVVGIPS
jgi:hypothetical protein